MTLDEVSNWKHAERLERGDDLMAPTTPREHAVFSLMALLKDEALSTRFTRRQADRLVANASVVIARLSEVEADPDRIQLRAQQRQQYDSQDQILERLTEIEAERDLLHGYLRQMRSPYVDLYDPDARGADEDDARLSREAADARAVDAGVQVKAS